MRLALSVALLLCAACGSRTSSGGISGPTSPPASDPPPVQDTTPPPTQPITISLPADAVPWTPAPVDSGRGAARCDPGETLPAPETARCTCAANDVALPPPTRVTQTNDYAGCGAPIVNAGGTLLALASQGDCCGYDRHTASVLQPDLSWARHYLAHRPLAIGLGTDAFLVAGGDPRSVRHILAQAETRTGEVEVRVPFPLDFFVGWAPWGYDGPFGAWPDGDGGLIVAATGAELDRTVALGLARVDATGALVAGPIRVASTERPLETSDLLWPLAAGVDGAGRILVVWFDWARCDDSYAWMSFAARWFDRDGTPIGETFDVTLDDWPTGTIRLADGSLALTTERGWLVARFADGKRGRGPVPAALATRDARRLVRLGDGFASVEPPCTHPDRQGRIEILGGAGESCGVITLPALVTCVGTRLREDDLVVGPDGTITEREADAEGECTFRVWPGAVQVP
jgi:hypothetical protein